MKSIFTKNIVNKKQRFISAFTLVELLVSVGIFTLMTALMVAKYGNFNQSVLLTNLAYDVAVTIRTAQAYGLSVKGIEGAVSTEDFQYQYGVHFDTTSSGNETFFIYIDRDDSNSYNEDGGDEKVSTLNLKRGAKISGVCFSDGCTPDTGTEEFDILFKRPDPSAKICSFSSCIQSYVKIQIMANDGNTRAVSVRENGQISVED